MKIGLLADIHDNLTTLAQAIEVLKEHRVEEVLVLGDICSPPTLMMLVDSGLRCRCIYGNNDGDKARLLRTALKGDGRVELADDEFAMYEFDGAKVFVSHYPQIASAVALSGEYRAVFYGHDHAKHWEKLANGTLLANPGEVWGLKTGVASCGVWDSERNEIEIIDLP